MNDAHAPRDNEETVASLEMYRRTQNLAPDHDNGSDTEQDEETQRLVGRPQLGASNGDRSGIQFAQMRE